MFEDALRSVWVLRALRALNVVERCAVCGEGAAGADGAVCANMAAVCAEGAVRVEGAGKKYICTKNHHVFEDDRLRKLRFESLQKIMKK